MTMTERQKEVDSLTAEYKIYINKLKFDWRSENKPPEFKDVYEVLRPHEREKIADHIALWSRYVTPIAEAWWKERGYGIVWPDDDKSELMQVYVLADI